MVPSGRTGAATTPSHAHSAPEASVDQDPPRIAVVVGATGLVGSTLCRQLIDDARFDQIIVLSRRPLPLEHRRLQVAEIDFDLLDEWTPDFEIDTVFCALGTTIAKAGSEDAFRAVDHDLVLTVARLAQRAQCTHFILISSAGADPDSASFYLRVKGETEESLRSLGFPHTVALRPSLLDGDRTEFRKGEQRLLRIGRALRPLMIGPLERWRPTPVELVATAMRDLAQPGRRGFEIVDAPQIAHWHERIQLTE